MKPILPSLREKKRYMVYQVISKQPVKFKETQQAIEKEVTKTLGTLEMAKANFTILPDWSGQKGLIKVNNKYVNKVRTAMMFLRNINKAKAITKIVRISGTIKKSRIKGG